MFKSTLINEYIFKLFDDFKKQPAVKTARKQHKLESCTDK